MPDDERPPVSTPVKLSIELGPIACFYGSYQLKRVIEDPDRAIYLATGVFMVAITASVIASRRLEGRWPAMALVTAVFVLVMGALTLLLQDATFIKLKPTIVNSLFGAILLGGLASGRLFLKLVLAEAMQLTDAGWVQLTRRFGLWFFFLAGLNELVWRTQSENFWMNFKVFGLAPLTMAFLLAQVGLLKRHALEPAEDGPQ